MARSRPSCHIVPPSGRRGSTRPFARSSPRPPIDPYGTVATATVRTASRLSTMAGSSCSTCTVAGAAFGAQAQVHQDHSPHLYTKVLLEVALEAAEAAARLVPRRPVDGVSTSLAPARRNRSGDRPEGRTPRSGIVRRQGLEPRTRGLRVRFCPCWTVPHGADHSV